MENPLFDIRLQLAMGKFSIDLDFRSNKRVLGLFGPSGSGKTTVLESVAGLQRQTKGRIRNSGRTLLDTANGLNLPPEQRHIGYVPQNHLLFPHLDVRDNICFGEKRVHRQADEGPLPALKEVVSILGIADKLDRRVYSLSGGECQRVSLARALCSGPRLLLLDEPLSSLDAGLRRRILPYLLSIRETFRLPMLVVSHNPAELLALCDEVIAIDAGRVVTMGAPVDVFTRSSVYESTMDSGYENMIPVVVMKSSGHNTVLATGQAGKGSCIRIPLTTVKPGSRVMAGLPAREIIIAREKVSGISARNHLEAVIRDIKTVRETIVLTAELSGSDPVPLVVELTRDAVHELQLEPGLPVHLLFKSTSVILYA